MDDIEFRAVLLHGFTAEEAVAIMKAAKAACPAAKGAAFATTTPTNIDWKVSDLLEHLGEEHEAMRTARAGKDTPA